MLKTTLLEDADPMDAAERLRIARQNLADLEREEARLSEAKRAQKRAFYKAAQMDLMREIAELETEQRRPQGNRRERALTESHGLAMARIIGKEMRDFDARLALVETRLAADGPKLHAASRAVPAVRMDGSSRLAKRPLLVVRLDGSSRPAKRPLPVVRLEGLSRAARLALPVVRSDGSSRPATQRARRLPVVKLIG